MAGQDTTRQDKTFFEYMKMTTRTKGDKWLSCDEVVYLTTLSRRTIDRLVAAGKFPVPVTNAGRKVFVKREINGWMEAQENLRKASA